MVVSWLFANRAPFAEPYQALIRGRPASALLLDVPLASHDAIVENVPGLELLTAR